jgi:hypothetical protein
MSASISKPSKHRQIPMKIILRNLLNPTNWQQYKQFEILHRKIHDEIFDLSRQWRLVYMNKSSFTLFARIDQTVVRRAVRDLQILELKPSSPKSRCLLCRNKSGYRLGYDAALMSNGIPTFRDDVVSSSPRVEVSLENEDITVPQNRSI